MSNEIITVTPLHYQMTVAGEIVNVTPEDYLRALDVDLKIADIKFKTALGDREASTAFQFKGQLILNGLAEIRCALNVPQVDESKEGSKEIGTALKNAFDDEEKIVLKKKYIHFVQLFHKHISQLYPTHKSSTENESGNQQQ
jgi:hypothetical protein